jgi:hypothetical protein
VFVKAKEERVKVVCLVSVLEENIPLKNQLKTIWIYVSKKIKPKKRLKSSWKILYQIKLKNA